MEIKNLNKTWDDIIRNFNIGVIYAVSPTDRKRDLNPMARSYEFKQVNNLPITIISKLLEDETVEFIIIID